MPTIKKKKELLDEITQILNNNGYEEITLFATDKEHNGILSTFKQTDADTAIASITMLIKLLSEELHMKSTDLSEHITDALESAEKRVQEELENRTSDFKIDTIL